MLKICENLLTGTLFKQLPQAQIRLKFKNFCAHHEANNETIVLSTENVQKSHLGTKPCVIIAIISNERKAPITVTATAINVAGRNWGRTTYHNILTLPIEERSCDGSTMIDTCRAEYDKLIEQSPPIPYFVIQAFEKQFPDDNGIFKPEIMHIQPIDMFISEDEMTNELKKDLSAIRGGSDGSDLEDVVIKS